MCIIGMGFGAYSAMGAKEPLRSIGIDSSFRLSSLFCGFLAEAPQCVLHN